MTRNIFQTKYISSLVQNCSQFYDDTNLAHKLMKNRKIKFLMSILFRSSKILTIKELENHIFHKYLLFLRFADQLIIIENLKKLFWQYQFHERVKFRELKSIFKVF